MFSRKRVQLSYSLSWICSVISSINTGPTSLSREPLIIVFPIILNICRTCEASNLADLPNTQKRLC